MCAKSKFVIVLFAVVGLVLGACAVAPQKQLEIPKVVRMELAGKDLNNFPFCVSREIVFYDPTVTDTKIGMGRFARTLPENEISDRTRREGEMFIDVLQHELKGGGFKLSGASPQPKCMNISTDLNFVAVEGLLPGTKGINARGARLRLSYDGAEVLETDYNGLVVFSPNFISPAARILYSVNTQEELDEERNRELAKNVIKDVLRKWKELMGG